MYLKHFGLSRLPFECVSNGSIYVDLPEHREAINTVLFGLRSGEGFTKVVGEPGSGKTALCQFLLSQLDSSFHKIYLPNGAADDQNLLISISEGLGIHVPIETSIHLLRKRITEDLLEIAKCGEHVALVIDEAQNLPKPALEQLRQFSNLESEHGKLIQIVLIGQPELDRNLAHPSLRQLQQRIAFSARLPALSEEACRLYIHRRIAQSGARPSTLFTPAACQRIHRASSGIPRIINALCHKSLIAAFSHRDRQVDQRHVARAICDTEGIRGWRTRPLFRSSRTIRSSKIASIPFWRSPLG